MNEDILKSVGFFGLLLSCLNTVITISAASGGAGGLGLFLFIIWAVSPYVCFFATMFLLSRHTSIIKLPLTFCVISALMFAFTFWAYVGTLGNKSSTYGLIFIFAPLYLHIGWFFLLAGSLFWRWLMSDKNNRG